MIEWTPALSTGVALLDEHHQAIFRWLAELESAAADQRTLLGAYAVARLQEYARAHFAAEEALMKSAGDPNLARHSAEHAEFCAQLDALQHDSIGQDVSASTVEFLRNWLTHHIARTDMGYVPYLSKLAPGEVLAVSGQTRKLRL